MLFARIVTIKCYTNDGMRQPRWDDEAMIVTVERTFALNSAYEEIRAGD